MAGAKEKTQLLAFTWKRSKGCFGTFRIQSHQFFGPDSWIRQLLYQIFVTDALFVGICVIQAMVPIWT